MNFEFSFSFSIIILESCAMNLDSANDEKRLKCIEIEYLARYSVLGTLHELWREWEFKPVLGFMLCDRVGGHEV